MAAAEAVTTLGDAATVVKKIRAAVAREAEALAPASAPKEMAAANGDTHSNGNGKNGHSNGADKRSNGKSSNGHAKDEPAAPMASKPMPAVAEMMADTKVEAVVAVVDKAHVENGNGKKSNWHDAADEKSSNGHSNCASNGAAEHAETANGKSNGHGKASNGHTNGVAEHAEAANGKTNGASSACRERSRQGVRRERQVR